MGDTTRILLENTTVTDSLFRYKEAMSIRIKSSGAFFCVLSEPNQNKTEQNRTKQNNSERYRTIQNSALLNPLLGREKSVILHSETRHKICFRELLTLLIIKR
jgi:hypothetical protein